MLKKGKKLLAIMMALSIVFAGVNQMAMAEEPAPDQNGIPAAVNTEKTNPPADTEAGQPTIVVNGDFTKYLTGFSFYKVGGAEYGEGNPVKDGDPVGIRYSFDLGDDPTAQGMTVGSTYTLPALPDAFQLKGTDIVNKEYDVEGYDFAKWSISENGIITIKIVAENDRKNVKGYIGLFCDASLSAAGGGEIVFNLGKFVAERTYVTETTGGETGKSSLTVQKKGSINKDGIITWTIEAAADKEKENETLAGYRIIDTYNGHKQKYVPDSMKIDGQPIEDDQLASVADGGFTYVFPENTTGKTATITYQTKVAGGALLDWGEIWVENKARLENPPKDAFGEATAKVLAKKTIVKKNPVGVNGNWRYEKGKYYADYEVNVEYTGNYETVKLIDTIGTTGATFVAGSVKVRYEGDKAAVAVDPEKMKIEGNKLTVNLDKTKTTATVSYTIEIADLTGLAQSGNSVTVKNSVDLWVSTDGTTGKTVGTDSGSISGSIKPGDGTSVDMVKSGSLQPNGRDILWQIRVNAAKRDLTEAVTITDTLGKGQTLKAGTMEITYNEKVVGEDKASVSVNGNIITFTLKDIGKNEVRIKYKTEIADQNPGTKYTNAAKLEYRGIEVNTEDTVTRGGATWPRTAALTARPASLTARDILTGRSPLMK